MKIFFDSEFTGLHKNTTLISMALIAEDGSSLYAEFNDFDQSQVDSWIEENVLENTINLRRNSNNILIKDEIINKLPKCEIYFGSKNTLKDPIKKWLEKFDNIELVTDVGHYDIILLIDFLYGDALNSKICTYIDVNFLIAQRYNININEAFDVSRTSIANIDEYNDFNKHNALYDALVLQKNYEYLTKPKRKGTKKKEN